MKKFNGFNNGRDTTEGIGGNLFSDNLERERKYLVKKDHPFVRDKYHMFEDINQMYLVDRKDHSLRIRISKISPHDGAPIAKICYKYYLSDDTKEEIEYPFSMDEALKIFKEKKYVSILQKTRFMINNWDIDLYPFGLCIAEYEFDENNPIPNPLPDWIDKDVTGVEEYSNIYIAKNWEELNKI